MAGLGQETSRAKEGQFDDRKYSTNVLFFGQDSDSGVTAGSVVDNTVETGEGSQALVTPTTGELSYSIRLLPLEVKMSYYETGRAGTGWLAL